MSRKISADDLMSVLPLLYSVEIGEGDQAIEPDVDDLYSRLRIDRNDLDGELAEHAALYAWWAVLAAEAELEVDQRQRQLDVVEAEVVTRLRGEGLPATVMHDARRGQPEYVDANDAYLIAKRNLAVIKAMLRSLEHRGQMLSALAYRRNREMDSIRAGGI